MYLILAFRDLYRRSSPLISLLALAGLAICEEFFDGCVERGRVMLHTVLMERRSCPIGLERGSI